MYLKYAKFKKFYKLMFIGTECLHFVWHCKKSYEDKISHFALKSRKI